MSARAGTPQLTRISRSQSECCKRCSGTGSVWRQSHTYSGLAAACYLEVCPDCRGTGERSEGEGYEENAGHGAQPGARVELRSLEAARRDNAKSPKGSGKRNG